MILLHDRNSSLFKKHSGSASKGSSGKELLSCLTRNQVRLHSYPTIRHCLFCRKLFSTVEVAIMMIGEQPGNQEDIQGRPFVGPAGKLLDKCLEEADMLLLLGRSMNNACCTSLRTSNFRYFGTSVVSRSRQKA